MADATKELQIIVSARDDASGALRNISGNLGTLKSRMAPVIGGLKQIGIVAAAAGAGFGALAIKSAFSASKINELQLALQAVAKANNLSSKQVNDAVKGLRKNNIAHKEALRITSNFVAAHIDMADAVKLSTAAKNLAIGTEFGSSQALDMLTQAIVTNQTQSLAQFGILTTQTQAFKDYGESIGKSSGELTSQERVMAIMNKVFEVAKTRVGAYDAAQQSAGKQFRSFTTRILPDFIAQLGKAFEPALLVIVDALTKKVQELAAWFENNQEIVKMWGERIAAATTMAIVIFGQIVTFLIENKEIILGVFVALAIGLAVLVGAFLIAHGVAIAVFAAIVVAVTLLLKAWNTNFLGMRTITQAFMNYLKNMFLPFIKGDFKGGILNVLDVISGGWVSRFKSMRNAVIGVIDAVKGLINAARDLASKVAGGLNIPGFQHGGFVPGAFSEAVPAILHGGERVIPRTGVDVNQGGNGGGVNINISGTFNIDSSERVQELADKIIRILGRRNELAGKGLPI